MGNWYSHYLFLKSSKNKQKCPFVAFPPPFPSNVSLFSLLTPPPIRLTFPLSQPLHPTPSYSVFLVRFIHNESMILLCFGLRITMKSYFCYIFILFYFGKHHNENTISLWFSTQNTIESHLCCVSFTFWKITQLNYDFIVLLDE